MGLSDLFLFLHCITLFSSFSQVQETGKKQDEWKFDETWECQRVFYLFFHLTFSDKYFGIRFWFLYNLFKLNGIIIFNFVWDNINLQTYSDFNVYIKSSSMMIQQLYFFFLTSGIRNLNLLDSTLRRKDYETLYVILDVSQSLNLFVETRSMTGSESTENLLTWVPESWTWEVGHRKQKMSIYFSNYSALDIFNCKMEL